MNIGNIVMVVVAALVLVAAIVGVIVGVSTHTEPGLQNVCWMPDGHAQVQNLTCEHPEELRWDRTHFPLTVSGPTDDSTIPSAVEFVNQEMGCVVLSWEPTRGSTAEVTVEPNATLDVGGAFERGGGTIFTRGASGRMEASVLLAPVGSDFLRERVLVHEFGHVLGLAHDPFQASIMYATYDPSVDDDTHVDIFRFTDNDRQLIHNLYCASR